MWSNVTALLGVAWTRLASGLGPLMLLLLLTAYGRPSSAMEFEIIRLPDGQRLVMAKGKIVTGDADRLTLALQSADRDRWGNEGMRLWSPGGSVAEAFAMVRVMDRVRVNTIVPPSMYCASACSQILFVSGFFRSVLDGGKLGMHSCSRGGKASEVCNDRIATNAVAHGVAHGAVMAFMRYVRPVDMLWLSAPDADCWGLTRWPPELLRGVQPGDIAPCVRRALRGH